MRKDTMGASGPVPCRDTLRSPDMCSVRGSGLERSIHGTRSAAILLAWASVMLYGTSTNTCFHSWGVEKARSRHDEHTPQNLRGLTVFRPSPMGWYDDVDGDGRA